MKKIINIDLIDKYDFLERYNQNKVSANFIEYLLKEAKYVSKETNIEININTSFQQDNLKEMLINALKEEYNRNVFDHHFNNIFQILLFFLGVFFLSLAALFKEGIIWKEIFLIWGWVPIWEMIELELFNDVRGRKRKFIIKKILDSKININ